LRPRCSPATWAIYDLHSAQAAIVRDYVEWQPELDRATWTIEYSYQPTDMNWYYTTTGIHTSNDIWYTVDPVADPYIGLTTCRALMDIDECEHWHVVYDEPWWIDASDVSRRSLACHETGHTVGLKHGSYGCLEEGQTWNQYLGAHNTSHINSRY
jgi:hypothetical protein